MECGCRVNEQKNHKVIRNFTVAGEYILCSHCQAIEWVWMTDDLEVELNETPGHFLKTGAIYGRR